MPIHRKSSQRKGGKGRKSAQKQARFPRLSIAGIADMDRVQLLIYLFGVASVLVALRLFIVQVIDHGFYQALASGQHELQQKLLPARGEIYAQDRYADDGLALLATNRSAFDVYANPKQITDPQKTTDVIAPILGMDPEVVLGRTSKGDDLYEPLKNRVSDQEVEVLEAAIEENGLTGIHSTPQEERYYPEGEVASSISGFVGLVDDVRKGQYGLEGRYEDILSGEAGYLNTELDAAGRFIAVGEKSIVEAQDGDALILTIDKNIQYKACTALEAAVAKYGAKQGSVLIMDPKTGDILAMCNAPLYDPNHYNEVEDLSVFINDAISDQYEPGSVFKALTIAGGLNDGVITPYTTYEDTGEVTIGQFTIRNSDGKANGTVDMTKVLEDSLNTGAIFVAQKLGNERWWDYVQAFGFGEKVDIGMSGDNPGNISSVGLLKDIYSATSSYGQGITVTPIQLLQAFSALANNGMMMKPQIVKRVVQPSGYQEEFAPVEVRQVLTPETARTASAMLVRVIDNGHAALAAVDGYFIAGKTGTAQVPKENGVGYDKNRHKDTFIGYGPVSDPQFVMLTKLDEPTNVPWSALSAAPLFGEIAQYLVNYLQIPPDRVE